MALDRLYLDLVELAGEEVSVLGIHDRLYGCPEDFDVVLGEYTALVEGHPTVESSLSAEG